MAHARVCAFLSACGYPMIGLGLVAGILTRTASAAGCPNALGNISVTKLSSGSLTIRSGSCAPGSAFYQRGLMKQALRICRHVESAFATLQYAMRSAIEVYRCFAFAQPGRVKQRNPPRMARFFTSLHAASSGFDAHFVSVLELTVEILSLLSLLSWRGVFAGLFSVDTHISKKLRTAR